MREIKFRAWDKFGHPNKVMTNVIRIEWDINRYKLKYNNQEYWRMLKQIELMQFIGIKDKNKKDIYDGDILGFKDKRIKRIEIVKYQKVYCEEYGDYIGFNFNENMEVIGNIYENPELLEKK